MSDMVSTLEVLVKVTAFYDSAWTKLLWVVGGAAGVVGVIMPILLQVYQRAIIGLR
jgi:hypothetical protein